MTRGARSPERTILIPLPSGNTLRRIRNVALTTVSAAATLGVTGTSATAGIYGAELANNKYPQHFKGSNLSETLSSGLKPDATKVGLAEIAQELILEIKRREEKDKNPGVNANDLVNKPTRVELMLSRIPNFTVDHLGLDNFTIKSNSENTPVTINVSYRKSFTGRNLESYEAATNLMSTSNPNYRALLTKAQKAVTEEERDEALMQLAQSLLPSDPGNSRAFKWEMEDAARPLVPDFPVRTSVGRSKDGSVIISANVTGDASVKVNNQISRNARSISNILNDIQQPFAIKFRRVEDSDAQAKSP
jgi:hypothetical protein